MHNTLKSNVTVRLCTAICVWDSFSSACLANVMQAATATMSWLVGRRDFFVDDMTEDSSSHIIHKEVTATHQPAQSSIHCFT